MKSFSKLAFREAILSVKKFENLAAREEGEVESGKQGVVERLRREFKLDHNLRGLELELEIRFLK